MSNIFIMCLFIVNSFAHDQMPESQDVEESRPVRDLAEWEMRASIGLDIQISDNELSPQGSYSDPDNDANIGGSAGFFVRHRLNQRFGYTTGGEFVARKIEQEYDWSWLSSDIGSTRYDVISFEIPIYAELYLGSQGRHTLYMGPKLATPLYEHCQNAIVDAAEGRVCIQDAARSLFIPLQLGYHLWFSKVFGFTFFIERSLTPIIDKEELEAKSTRSGALAVFYF